MADSLERATNLLALLLESRVPMTLDDIAFALAGQYPDGREGRRGAFERDKSLLRDVGVPIETEVLAGDQAGQTAYRIDRARYELADLHLTPAEQQALQLAVAAVRSSTAQFGLLKLGGEATDMPAVAANIAELPALPALREAIVLRAEASFAYHGRTRALAPYALLLREGFWYVIGHDREHDEVRTYRVDRIEDGVSVGVAGSFQRPPGFDATTAFPADPKEIGDGPGERATVLVDASRAGMVLRGLGNDAEAVHRSDGSVELQVACANLDAFRSWLFGLGTHAEVLAPPDVRAAVVAWLRGMAAA